MKPIAQVSVLVPLQISWLNTYHANVRAIVGEELKAQGKSDVYGWLLKNTEPLG